MPEAGHIYSNLKRVTTSYDEEMALPQASLDLVASLPRSDRKPTAEEEDDLALNFERGYLAAARQRRLDQRRFKGKEIEAMRLVNILHPHTIFRRLRRAGVDARIEAPSFYVWVPEDSTGRLIAIKRERSIGRLWLHDEAVAGRVGVSAWVWDQKLKQRVRRMVTTLQYPYGPEWSLLHFNEFDVPICERYRGWRTAMLAMIEANVLTEDEVNRAFGPPSLNTASLLYRERVQTHRKRKYGLIQ
jgi:hypothetical protein